MRPLISPSSQTAPISSASVVVCLFIGVMAEFRDVRGVTSFDVISVFKGLSPGLSAFQSVPIGAAETLGG